MGKLLSVKSLWWRRESVKNLRRRKAQSGSVEVAEPKAAPHGLGIVESNVKYLTLKTHHTPTQPVHKISVMLYQETNVVVRLGIAFGVGASFCYAASRFYLVVESFLSLRPVLIRVYAAVSWVQNFSSRIMIMP